MINRTADEDDLKGIYEEYLTYMSRYYVINHHDSWLAAALKNLKRHSAGDDRCIYAMKEAKTIIGFAFVNRHLRFNQNGFAVTEFYIGKDHERQGRGRTLAEHVFEQFPGNWEVAVTATNQAARLFWTRVISDYTRGEYVEKIAESFSGTGFLFNNGSLHKKHPGH